MERIDRPYNAIRMIDYRRKHREEELPTGRQRTKYIQQIMND